MDTGPVTAGFTVAATWGDGFFPFICDECGALVARSAAERHLAWHEQVVTDATLAQIHELTHYA